MALHNPQAGISIVEVLVSATLLSVASGFAFRFLKTNLRAEDQRKSVYTLDTVERAFRGELANAGPTAILSLFSGVAAPLSNCLNGVGCNSGLSYYPNFIAPDNLHIPPRYRETGEPCDLNVPTIVDCPYTLQTRVMPVCERDVASCTKPQLLSVNYSFMLVPGTTKKLPVRSGVFVVRFP